MSKKQTAGRDDDMDEDLRMALELSKQQENEEEDSI